MQIKQLTAQRFRNLQDFTLQPSPDCNVIIGPNAQGKTNVLEAIWLFTGSKSFRGAKDREMIAFDQQNALLKMGFFAAQRDQTADIVIEKGRTATLNELKLSSPSKMAGVFCGVVFSPAHLQLIKQGPQERRHFIDAAYCQLRPGYLSVLSEYLHTLQQRNTLLKDSRHNSQVLDLLDIFSDRLATGAVKVWAARQAYIQKLAPQAAEIYGGISRQTEKLEISYQNSANIQQIPPEQQKEAFLSALSACREQDLAMGFTTIGPHRDDLSVTVDGNCARAYASQGQQRSAVLALKLAEASLLRQVTGEQPIALLDDVMSELDPMRQEYILNHIRDWQVFITCCDPSALLRMKSGKQFHMKQGVLIEQ